MDQVKHAKPPMATTEKLDIDKERKRLVKRSIEAWSAYYFILPLVDLTSCLVYAYVLDFKPPLKNPI